ncbi:5-azacytidine resistance protein azr1 [Niveomyces insectorum RCEF 264]|uniref:Protein phosphatase n=1 Tax=Niveomyces insectorum RCEF 264 TaxID=1081102 RepID=A0A168AAW9_9HYPO|nr:5-azacytidine resistance protein azr1 [Niveomyces insectorum RCEF 264]
MSTDGRRRPPMGRAQQRQWQPPPLRPYGNGNRLQPSAPGSRRSVFSYSVAASYIAKDCPFDPSTHVFHFNPYNRLQQNRQTNPAAARPESGQDAFFVSRVGDTGAVALGVADGVGGWMDSGVDPADFSHGLCTYMAAAAYEHGRRGTALSSSSLPLSARRLMDMGYRAVQQDRTIRAGGSTAVVGLLTPDGALEVANLGDSGFVQLRPYAVHAHSEPQTHAFNTPFQLSVVPPNLLARMAAFGGAQLSDEPRDAEVTRHRLQHGDVLVFASDGVWDNLFNQDILRLVSGAMTATGAWRTSRAGPAGGGGVDVADGSAAATESPATTATAVTAAAPAADLRRLTRLDADVAVAVDNNDNDKTDDRQRTPSSSRDHGGGVTLQSLLATQITAAAKAASVNTTQDGPFAKEVKRYYPHETWHGGKVDDICVVVVVVTEEPGDGAGGPFIKSRL